MAPRRVLKAPLFSPVTKPFSSMIAEDITAASTVTTMRMFWLFVALLSSVATEGSPSITNSVTIASCRAACLHVFTSSSDARDVKCRKNSDCFMCWNSCGILRHQTGIWGSMCADHTACLPGCQVACGFYLSSSRNGGGLKPYMVPPPPPLPAYQSPPRISGRSQVVWGALDWSGSAAPPRDDVIYVLFINSGSGWREVVQTSSRSTHMPPGVTGVPTLKLLAVTQEGIVAASDTLLQTPSVHPGSVEYSMEDLRPDASDHIPEQSTISISPEHTYSSPILDEASETQFSEFYPYEHFESRKVAPKDAFPPAPSALVDPTWLLQVVSVEPGIMAEVKVVWESRGPDGVEYLLSWVEESGGVSGHLLTDQLTTDLSLWPGQGYYVQVELVDAQGNPAMKSLATPVIFRNPTTGGSITERNTPSVSIQQSSPITPNPALSHEISTASIQDDTYRAVWLNNGTLIAHDGSSPDTTKPYENLHDSVISPGSTLPELIPPKSESDYTKVTTRVDSGLRGSIAESEAPRQRPPPPPPSHPTSRGGSSIGVSAREIPTILASEGGSEEVLWYVGVSMGGILILILCSLVLWSLGKCRKTPRNDSEYIEDRLNGVRESFREDFIRRNTSNPQTSWTFEKCCAATRDPRLGSPSRKDNLPAGIDNASLVENYVLMLESRPPKKKPRH